MKRKKGKTMDDLISRAQAIDALKHNQDVYSHNFHDDPIDKYTTAIIATDIETIVNLPSAQLEQRWIPCGKCIHADGRHRRCKILDRSINEDYFCYWAEPFKEAADGND